MTTGNGRAHFRAPGPPLGPFRWPLRKCHPVAEDAEESSVDAVPAVEREGVVMVTL